MTALRPIVILLTLGLLAACAPVDRPEQPPPAKTEDCDREGGIGGTGQRPNRPDCLKIGGDAAKRS